MKAIAHGLQYMSLVLLLFAVVSSSRAQTLSRIGVWFSPTSTLVELDNCSAKSESSALQVESRRYQDTGGYYVDVDTSTDGTNANPGLDRVHFGIGSGAQTLAAAELPQPVQSEHNNRIQDSGEGVRFAQGV
jgi:hypothetical protein